MNPCLNFFFLSSAFFHLRRKDSAWCHENLDEFVERNGGKKATVIKLVFDF